MPQQTKQQPRFTGSERRIPWLLALALALVVVGRMLPLFLLDKSATQREQLTYRGDDGHEYVHLGDYDSYYWVRAARQYWANGTVCDRRVDGRCHDDYTLAPIGGNVEYEHSLHVL